MGDRRYSDGRRVRRWVVGALLLAACSGKQTATGTSDAAADGGPAGCGTCRSDQVCAGSSCVDVPSACPCPQETYCDLGANRCVIGCTSDQLCNAGRICIVEERRCVAGCRDDVGCAAGQICQNEQCIAGCRADTACGTGRICENLACVPGCRTSDSECEGGRICVSQACIPGCRTDAACTAGGQICEGMQCVAGCRADAACGAGRICEGLQCQAGCRADAGCGAGQICVATTCRTGCRDHTACPAGQVCDATALTCRNCSANPDCPAATPICEGGLCTKACTADTDCPLERICRTSDQRCVPGCWRDGINGYRDPLDSSRCPAGTACTATSCTGEVCSGFRCSQTCEFLVATERRAVQCTDGSATNYQCTMFSAFGDPLEAPSLCLVACSGSSCPAGQVCSVTLNDNSFCNRRCQSDADCRYSFRQFSTTPCTCNTTTGQCSQGAYVCIHHQFVP